MTYKADKVVHKGISFGIFPLNLFLLNILKLKWVQLKWTLDVLTTFASVEDEKIQLVFPQTNDYCLIV